MIPEQLTADGCGLMQLTVVTANELLAPRPGETRSSVPYPAGRSLHVLHPAAFSRKRGWSGLFVSWYVAMRLVENTA